MNRAEISTKLLCVKIPFSEAPFDSFIRKTKISGIIATGIGKTSNHARVWAIIGAIRYVWTNDRNVTKNETKMPTRQKQSTGIDHNSSFSGSAAIENVVQNTNIRDIKLDVPFSLPYQ